MKDTSNKINWICWQVGIICFSLSVFFTEFSYQTGNFTSRLMVTRAIVENGSIDITPYQEYLTVDQSHFQSKVYSDKPIGSSLLMVIPYFIIEHILNGWELRYISEAFSLLLKAWVAEIFSLCLLSACFMVIFTRMCIVYLNVSKSKMLLISFAYFGSLIFPYSTIGMGENYVLLFLVLSAYYLLKTPSSTKYIILSSLWLLISIQIYYQVAILVFPWGLYLLLAERSKFILWSVGIIVALFLVLLYNRIFFGGWFHFAYNYCIAFSTMGLQNNWEWVGLNKFYQVTISPWRGILFYMPVLILLFQSSLWVERIKKYSSLIWTGPILMFYLYLLFYKEWDGGSCFGLRYIVPALPFAYAIIIGYLSKIKWNILHYTLVSYTLSISILGTITDPHVERSFQNPVIDFCFPYLLQQGPNNILVDFNRHLSGYHHIAFSYLTLLIPLSFVVILYMRKKNLKHDAYPKQKQTDS